ncbi:MAG: epoxyqueuosine reductase QueH [Desulfomonile tiedjei]|uniref:Epoxyqueuosine reductase QueH n=1 Tax=Desulfomonile tiedjei TaxID=2358 RepID=A0A9D6V4Z0_9BACT|nr:epoxyqueuosine reductase QueH [Desulfomonile tiedjei]
MKILLHACCAPCLVHPLEDLRSEGHEVTAVFFNPNIHPYAEYLRRLDAFTVYTQDNHVRVLNADFGADMEEWLREVVFREAQRCKVCFNFRMDAIAALAEAKGFDAFSTTLLYSRFQKHDLLKQICEAASEKYGMPFIYKDWRTGWNEGVKKYRKLGLYRQKYCGCVYSEKERALKII